MSLSLLSAHNVTVGFGVEGQGDSRNLHFGVTSYWLRKYCCQAALEVNGILSKHEVYTLASVNLECSLGIQMSNKGLVAVEQ